MDNADVYINDAEYRKDPVLNLKIVKASFVVKNSPLSLTACNLLNEIIGKVKLNGPEERNDKPLTKLRKQINGKQFTAIDRNDTSTRGIESEGNANLLALIIPIMEDRYDDIKINCNEIGF